VLDSSEFSFISVLKQTSDHSLIQQ